MSQKDSLESFLTGWDSSYLGVLYSIPLFDPAQTAALSQGQRRRFVQLFYHVRGHFGEVLWELGQAAPDAKFKEIILDNIREEFGGNGAGHEHLFLKLCKELGVDLSDEFIENKHYLPSIRIYNDAQLKAIRRDDWNTTLITFAAGEHLDNLDYAGLRGIFESFGLHGNGLEFFNAHADAQHFSGPLRAALESLWQKDPASVEHAFTRVRRFQLAMWRELSDLVFDYRETDLDHHQANRNDGSASGQSLQNIESTERHARLRGIHYSPTAFPRLRGRYSDLLALEAGDTEHLRLELDDRTRRRLERTPADWSWAKTVLVFGANGFVGGHLLHRLLADPRVDRVYAIVRPEADNPPAARIASCWKKYDLSGNPAEDRKLVILDGSMTVRDFGLSPEVYRELSTDVDTVFQCAGSTDYVPSYLELRSDWVFGLLGVLQFCFQGRSKQIGYLGSSISSLYTTPEDFRRPDSWWYSGYTQMKWVNQNILRHLTAAGFRAQVCEAPYILGSTTVGKDPGYVYSFWRIISLAATMQIAFDGVAPTFSAVDLLCDAVVRNAQAPQPLPVIRPLAPNPLGMAELAPLLNCRVMSWDEVYEHVMKYATPEILRMLPRNTPEMIARTNCPAIYPQGTDLSGFPPIKSLAQLYLKQMKLI